jgi:hypothetical protein
MDTPCRNQQPPIPCVIRASHPQPASDEKRQPELAMTDLEDAARLVAVREIPLDKGMSEDRCCGPIVSRFRVNAEPWLRAGMDEHGVRGA